MSYVFAGLCIIMAVAAYIVLVWALYSAIAESLS